MVSNGGIYIEDYRDLEQQQNGAQAVSGHPEDFKA